MAQVNAGRVRFISRGEYNNSTQYYLFDLVDYNGSSYFAKANTTGNVPTNTTYWQLVAEKGNTGNVGPTGPTGNGIASIVKTASAGLIDTYTITFTNGSTTTFNVTNGQDGDVTQEYVDEENERLKSVFNVLPKVNGTGESVTLENTGDTMLYKMDLKGNASQEVIQGEVGLEEEDTSIYVDDVNEDKENYITLKGNTYQETTTGKNLFHIDDFNATNHGITLTIKDNTFTLNGTNDGTESVFYLSRTPITTGSSTSIKLFIEGGTATNTIAPKLYSYVEWGNQVQSNITEDVINPMSANVTYNRYILGIKGGTFNNYKFSPMIAENLTSTDTYEPYTNGASPNPDYPQEIEVVTGLNEVKVEGKNLFDVSKLINGIWNRTEPSPTRVIMFLGKVNQGDKVSVTNLDTTNYRFSVGFTKLNYPSSSNIIVNESGWTTNSTYTITASGEGYPFLQISRINNGNISPSDVTGLFQFELGELTPYESYKGQTYEVNLGSIELCKIGTYQDRIYKSNGNWYLHKEFGKAVLNGSEYWVKSITTTDLDRYSTGITSFPNSSMENFNNGISNYFLWDINERVGTFKTIKNKQSVFFDYADKDTSTLDMFKNWLSTHNTEVYYILATPTDTQITDTTLVNQLEALYTASIHAITHINTETSNLLPYIDLKYNVITPAPSPERASEVEVVKGNNTITISNEDGTKTQTFNITLGNLELCKIGDYQDYFYKENGNWYKYKEIQEVVFDGTENWTINNNISTNDYKVFYRYIDGMRNYSNLKSNLFEYKNARGTDNCIYTPYNNELDISISSTICTTATEFKNWLSAHNTTCYYVLATPTTTQITDQLLVSQLDELQKAMSYYDKTLITQVNDDKPFILDVIGIRDLQDIFNL